MLVGPVFTREVVTTPRRPRLYIYRSVYASGLFVLVCTAWLVLAGTQVINDVGDMARFGSILFTILAPLQLALCVFFAALSSAGAVAQEKDRRTMLLLLMTRLTNHELVLGKLSASLLNVLVMLAAALPIFMLSALLGGVSFQQVGWVFAVTAATALVAGSLGSTVALWREKTFQTLALSAMLLVVWLVIWEPLHAGFFGRTLVGLPVETIATSLSPVRAVLAAARPVGSFDPALGIVQSPVNLFLMLSLLAVLLLNAAAIVRVRAWNAAQEVRRASPEPNQERGSIWGTSHEAAEQARAGHVDSQLRTGQVAAGRSREVWDNPILWREICTWAYGRKVMAIRIAFVLLFALAAAALYFTSAAGGASSGGGTVLPAAALPLLPLFLVSLVIVNALAVTSVTNERDGRALDLLLATDLSPKEFIFGKLGGVLWVTKEMIVLPLLLCGTLWWTEGLTLENLLLLWGGLAVMFVFVSMLGLHCGMTYANSRTAITVSLGTVFFLFLGVVTCVMMMISFSGSFQVQLAPFLAFILGGGVGLYVSLGIRNPSPAIGAASLCVPFATFYAIVSFLRGMPLAVFLVMSIAYGFTTLAMLIPAIYEFDVAMGRTTGGDE